MTSNVQDALRIVKGFTELAVLMSELGLVTGSEITIVNSIHSTVGLVHQSLKDPLILNRLGW